MSAYGGRAGPAPATSGCDEAAALFNASAPCGPWRRLTVRVRRASSSQGAIASSSGSGPSPAAAENRRWPPRGAVQDHDDTLGAAQFGGLVDQELQQILAARIAFMRRPASARRSKGSRSRSRREDAQTSWPWAPGLARLIEPALQQLSVFPQASRAPPAAGDVAKALDGPSSKRCPASGLPRLVPAWRWPAAHGSAAARSSQAGSPGRSGGCSHRVVQPRCLDEQLRAALGRPRAR